MLSITGEVFQRRDGSFVIRTSDNKVYSLNELLRDFDIPCIDRQLPDRDAPGKVLTITVADIVDSPYAW